ncbi:uncharacterized protein N0V89_004605 [Didymosphaeria variabile]|uniref:Uncharacterized protein n=1 Tax=Didymosphaeria variabile TaxID=1932322 RepID=A0A9W8XSS9_9PLEO|nr:uncharacterized protein N0V89_004605 [Didymosphaeria variabile]KAJ4356570.1 hypothetical protein N0V89_004605 [Didymosphaeria variabile]
MPRYSPKVPDAQSIVNKFNQVRCHQRLNLKFDELEKLYFCESNIGFPAPATDVLEAEKNRRGELPPMHVALGLTKRYANMKPNEILDSLQMHEHRRYTARFYQQQDLVWAHNNAGQPGFQGQHTIQPQDFNFSGPHNPSEQLSAVQVAQPMGSMMIQEPAIQEQPTFQPQVFNYNDFQIPSDQLPVAQVTQPMGGLMIQESGIQVQSMFQPQEHNYNGFQNHSEQLPAAQSAQPMGGMMFQEPIESQQMAADNDAMIDVIDPFLLGLETPWVPIQDPAALAANDAITTGIGTSRAPIQRPAALPAGNDRNDVLAAVAPGPVDVPALIRDISANSQPTPPEHVEEGSLTIEDTSLPVPTEAETEEWTRTFLRSRENGFAPVDDSKENDFALVDDFEF